MIKTKKEKRVIIKEKIKEEYLRQICTCILTQNKRERERG